MMHQKIAVLLAFLCLGAVNFCTGQTDEDKGQPKEPKHGYWRNIRIIEGFIDIKLSKTDFNFPPDVYFSPMYRWGGQQVAGIVPPLPRNWLNTIGLGVNVHPLPLKFLNGIIVGYTFNKQFGYQNDFRDGKFLSRAQYANGENAFTYVRLSGFGPTSTFRFAYSIPLWRDKNNTGLWGDDYSHVFLELGPKYSEYYNLEVTQGHDTFNEDVVYRRTSGKGHTLGGYAIVKFLLSGEKGRARAGLRLGVEYEKGSFTFHNFPGKQPFSMLSINFFGLEIGF